MTLRAKFSPRTQVWHLWVRDWTPFNSICPHGARTQCCSPGLTLCHTLWKYANVQQKDLHYHSVVCCHAFQRLIWWVEWGVGCRRTAPPPPPSPLSLFTTVAAFSLLLSFHSDALFCSVDGHFLSPRGQFNAIGWKIPQQDRSTPTIRRATDGPWNWPTGSGGGMGCVGRAISLLGCARNPSRYEQTLLYRFAYKRTPFFFRCLFLFPMRRGRASGHCFKGTLHPSVRPSACPSTPDEVVSSPLWLSG